MMELQTERERKGGKEREKEGRRGKERGKEGRRGKEREIAAHTHAAVQMEPAEG